MIASPAKRSIIPPCSSRTTGTVSAQYAFSIASTSAGEWFSENSVKPWRSAKRMLTSRSSPPSAATSGSSRSRAASWGEERRESRLHRPDLLCRPTDDRRLVGAEAEAAAQLLLVEALGSGLDRRCVPAVDPAERLVQVERREHLAAMAFTERREGHDPERRRHQQVPLPPRGVPVAGEGDRDRSLPEEDPGRRDAGEHLGRPAPVQAPVAPGGDPVEEDGRDSEPEEPAVRRVLGELPVERRDLRDGNSRPGRQNRHEPPPEEADVAHDWTVDRRPGGEHGGDQEPHRGRDHEPCVFPPAGRRASRARAGRGSRRSRGRPSRPGRAARPSGATRLRW